MGLPLHEIDFFMWLDPLSSVEGPFINNHRFALRDLSQRCHGARTVRARTKGHKKYSVRLNASLQVVHKPLASGLLASKPMQKLIKLVS